MQIIIPMSGFGERFRRAGYTVPKPLITIDGKPMLAHMLSMFPGEQKIIFICNQTHLDTPSYHMADIIKAACPTGTIVGIPPHKLGPVHAVNQITGLLDPHAPVLVNYCDFTCYWSWQHFKHFAQETNCAGIIPAYRGFHPHLLGSTNYAYLREHAGWVNDIQEKQPYTNNRMAEYASSGTYYFATAALMTKALAAVVSQDLNFGGEFYLSLAYKILLAEQLPVAVYPIQHFMQWGTPEDLAEYLSWSTTFRHLSARADQCNKPPQSRGTVMLTMAGLGQRFTKEGYSVPKPLLEVSGRPMVAQATYDLPLAARYAFILRAAIPGYQDLSATLHNLYPQASIVPLEHLTEGAPCTAATGIASLQQRYGNFNDPLTIAACDNGALYSKTNFLKLLQDPAIDVIVWGACNYPYALKQAQMFSWIATTGTRVSAIAVKNPLAPLHSTPIVIGTFTFKRTEYFQRAYEHLLHRNQRTNGEFYMDELINDAIKLGLRCHVFIVDSYLCWGTPNELRTFEYWQSCFHKWPHHPYRLELDPHIPQDKIAILAERYKQLLPPPPN